MGIETTRILVLFEPNATGGRALREGLAAAAGARAELTVVTLAPQLPPSHRCGPTAEPYNCAAREQAESELRSARELVWASGAGASFKVLIDDQDPPLEQWVLDRAFQLVLVPRHRLAPAGHPAARRLRRATQAEVRVVT